MFKKLKIKFVLINMGLLTAVFIGIFGTIYLSTAYSIEKEMRMQLWSNINLSKMLSDTLLVFEVVIFEKGLILEEDIVNDIFINGEKDQIKKLISILMDNAIKYTNDNGKILVSLKAERNKAKLIIKNTGEGIKKEHLEKIFERFYRVDDSRDRGTGGYGLGLSIAKAIVDDHKGKIHAESIINNETSFIVELPLIIG